MNSEETILKECEQLVENGFRRKLLIARKTLYQTSNYHLTLEQQTRKKQLLKEITRKLK